MKDQPLIEHRYKGEAPLQTLWLLFEGNRLRLLIAGGIYMIKHSPVWLMPLLTANIIDVVLEQRPIAELWWNTLLLVLLLAQNVPMHILYMRELSTALRYMETRLRSALARQLQRLSIGYYTRTSKGVLQNKVIRDVEAIEQMVRQCSDSGLGAGSNLMGALIITAIRVPAFLPFLLIMTPISAVLVQSMRQTLSTRNQNFHTEVERMAAQVAEMTNLMPIARAHGLEREELARMDTTLTQVRTAGMELDVSNAIFAAVSWVTYNIFNVICLVAASWAAYTQIIPISAGDVIMLTGYFGSLTNSIMALISLAPPVSKGMTSIRSIGEVLQSPDLEHNEGKTALHSVQGDIKFEQVTFRFSDLEDAAISDFSLHVQPGENIALVGHSGAGKSTILNLVIGFVRTTSGRILLDGQDMNTIDLRTYRSFMSVVPQETILFEGSVYDNVTYGIKNVTDAEVELALRNANAWDFIQALPDKAETRIGERGAKLSGGQKQRIAIARALIRNPRILIFDEATSALDNESEALIQQALSTLMKGRTTFVAAHRLSTIQNADKIIVMEHGKIIEMGTHTELIQNDKTYTRLHKQYKIAPSI